MSKEPENKPGMLLDESEELFAAGGAWLEALYGQWIDSPNQVSADWRAVFEANGMVNKETVDHRAVLRKMSSTARLSGAPTTHAHTPCDGYPVEHPSRAMYLIHAWRVYGHTQAKLDPLCLSPLPARPELELNYYGLSEADLNHEFPTGDMAGEDRLPLRDILARLQRTYAGSIGPELMHISNSAKKHWLFERLESMQGTQNPDADVRQRTFEHVMHADAFEHFLHTRYMGQKRFSLEGGESLIPMLDRLIQKSGETGVKEIILGMAHRGRLNVLANVLGKSLTDIFAEFEGTQLQDETHRFR